MKVAESLNKPHKMEGFPGKDGVKASENKNSAFHTQLRRVEGHQIEERLNHLADQITAQGEKLSKKVDLRELKIYKKLISEFLDEAVNGSHKFTKNNFLDRRGRHRVYAVVKKINSELENLTKDVLNEEKDNIKILQRVEDIRGLILDIIM